MIMKYVEMSIEEAVKLGTSTVLVAVKDLENDEDTIQQFYRKTKDEYIKIIKDAETVIKIYDEFIDSIRAFTHKQPDILNIIPKGKMRTILLNNKNE